ncbi:hypothetical protein AB0I72_19285 [Nocardiopsis sp. NPDC049922]|uniref:hypothetical protein n=1 Tax=Nocardiopsis sp. NPDC049922 TaxID=3155157 RepID=UPI0033EC5026
MTGWYTGSCAGAATAFGVVYLYAQDVLAWPWLLVTSPMVILGGIVGLVTQLLVERLRGYR